MTPSSAVLVTVSGPDHKGITSELTGILARSGAQILDMGQAVIHGLLSLSILFELKPQPDRTLDHTPIKDLLFKATELGLKLDFQVIEPQAKSAHLRSNVFRYAVTLISDNLSAASVHEVTGVLVKFGLNIDTIQRLSEGEFGCIEMLVSSGDELDRKRMKSELLRIANEQGVDIALQAEGLFRRTKRLVVLDMDSTLIQSEVVDELAREKGCFDDVAQITKEAMNGQISFDESLERRVHLLKGLKRDQLDQVFQRLKLTPGAEALISSLRSLGYRIALISGGFLFVAERYKDRFGLDYVYANQLEFEGETLSGKVIPPIVNAQRKADLLDVICQQERIRLDQVIAIGDGANDLMMLEKAGLGIAFNAKPVVRKQADLSVNQKSLRSILYLLGMSTRDLDQLLGENGK